MTMGIFFIICIFENSDSSVADNYYFGCSADIVNSQLLLHRYYYRIPAGTAAEEVVEYHDSTHRYFVVNFD